MLREAFIEERKESLSAVVVMFPWVFAVQYNGNDESVLGTILDDASQSSCDIIGRRFRRRLVIDESKGIGELTVAEQDGQRLPGFPDLVRLIQGRRSVPWEATHRKRSCQNALVGGQPPKAYPMDEQGISGQTDPSEGHRPDGGCPNVS